MKELIITDKNGKITVIHNCADHHIVPKSTKGAEKLFEELGLDINGKENTMPLPADEKLAEYTCKTQHIGRHEEEYMREAREKINDIIRDLKNDKISKVEAKEQLLEFIKRKQHNLNNKLEYLNKIGRPKY